MQSSISNRTVLSIYKVSNRLYDQLAVRVGNLKNLKSKTYLFSNITKLTLESISGGSKINHHFGFQGNQKAAASQLGL